MVESRPGAEIGFLHRIVVSDEELEASRLRQRRQERGLRAVATCVRGGVAELSGRLRAVQHIPGVGFGGSPTVEAELFDGSDSVTLIWLGRSAIGGITAGARLRVRGRVALREGRKVVFNPWYILEAGEQ